MGLIFRSVYGLGGVDMEGGVVFSIYDELYIVIGIFVLMGGFVDCVVLMFIEILWEVYGEVVVLKWDVIVVLYFVENLVGIYIIVG